MVTTLRQLLADLTDRAGARPAAASIEDVSGALAHLGRALSGLAEDGLTPGDSHRQRNATALAAACTTAGRLWPHGGGPLTDLAGAAALPPDHPARAQVAAAGAGAAFVCRAGACSLPIHDPASLRDALAAY